LSCVLNKKKTEKWIMSKNSIIALTCHRHELQVYVCVLRDAHNERSFSYAMNGLVFVMETRRVSGEVLTESVYAYCLDKIPRVQNPHLLTGKHSIAENCC
jgi:hypothetical protein